MARISWLVVLPPAVFAAVAGLFLGGLWRAAPNELPSAFIDLPAPTLPDESLAIQDLATAETLASGEVTLVNFWASWCPPCLAEHPRLLAMQAEGLRVVGINFRDTETAATEYLTRYDDPFIAGGFDPSGRSSIDWGVTAPPETFIIGGDGTVLFRFTGPLVGSDYEQRFVPALNAALAD